MADAACKDEPDEFFPNKGKSPDYAKLVCGLCPVKPECEVYTAEQKPDHGVWAGKLHQPPSRQKR